MLVLVLEALALADDARERRSVLALREPVRVSHGANSHLLVELFRCGDQLRDGRADCNTETSARVTIPKDSGLVLANEPTARVPCLFEPLRVLGRSLLAFIKAADNHSSA